MTNREEEKEQRVKENKARVDAYKKEHQKTAVVYKTKMVDGKMVLTERKAPE